MIATGLATAIPLATIGLLVAIRMDNLPTLDALAFLTRCGQALFSTAGTAILPEVTQTKDIERTNSKLFAAKHALGELGGPPRYWVNRCSDMDAKIW